MARDLSDAWSWIDKIVRRMSRLESGAMLENSSITNGRMRFIGGTLRVDSGGQVQIIGTLSIDGTTQVTGSFNLTGNGWNISGDGTISGNVAISGALNVTNNTTLNGPVTLNSTLSISSGQIRAGDVTITPSGGGRVEVGNIQIDGSSGGTIRSSGTVYMINSGSGSTLRVTGSISSDGLLVLGKITAAELNVTGAKNFQMPHPTKPGHWLRHGSTESPVSGIEYWGDGVLDDDGQCIVELPEYFESLAKPENRSVLITGRGHSPDWSDIDDGSFTVNGEPGGRFSWLVKAERFGGDFLLEETIPEEEVSEWAV